MHTLKAIARLTVSQKQRERILRARLVFVTAIIASLWLPASAASDHALVGALLQTHLIAIIRIHSGSINSASESTRSGILEVQENEGSRLLQLLAQSGYSYARIDDRTWRIDAKGIYLSNIPVFVAES